MYKGIKYVKKAGMWLFYQCFNDKNKKDINEWFDTEEEARKRYEK